MCTDLHLPYPPSPADLVVVPTSRDPQTGLALSSRNTYLTDADRPFAPLLVRGLRAGEAILKERRRTDANATVEAEEVLGAARRVVEEGANDRVRLDFYALNDPHTLEPLKRVEPGKGAILSGAMWVAKTRLIDNLLLDVREDELGPLP